MKDLTQALHVQVDFVQPDVEDEQAEATANMSSDSEEESSSSTPAPKKVETADADLVFDIDAFGKKASEEGTEEPITGGEPTVPGEHEASALVDIQDHWAKQSIERAIALGIVNGYEDGTFRPDGDISRAEFTAMIGRALKLQGTSDELGFADADSIPNWVKPTVGQAVQEGIVNSYEDQTFRADRKITRSEIAVMIARALKLPNDSENELDFADADQVPDWAKAQVAAAVELGMINGRDNNLFAPNASATRAEAVTLILAMLNHVK
ncbi:Endo-1,4-beta-xylanase A precursor [Paenibacillus konkukensis]|uniref:Endo-1,4-beta-xylanase A n=1 Tax=Paenibacillus konkukensis TaxID=2020716 RepID=A0ABY4RUD1_9BACL|nr:S-layer homology domain-containing protein [Paenibacillus konkukensis]UQZ85027.1 Endo-1,4-beta-xylanase A precursor [Paenibacillus konkukensis]